MENERTHQTYVSFFISELLKKAGFDWETVQYYHTSGKEIVQPTYNFSSNFNSLADYGYSCNSAPTLEVAQRWLREVKGVNLVVTLLDDGGFSYKYTFKKAKAEWFVPYETYELALEKGIEECLKYIVISDDGFDK
jgi:hypothetical protein